MFQFIANFLNEKRLLSMPRFKVLPALNLNEPGRVLVFAPHPDDDILGCGGTLAKLAKTSKVCVVLVTDGGGAGDLPSGTDKVRQDEFKSALDLIGVNDVIFLNQPDGFFIANERLRSVVITVLTELNPDWIFLPSHFDYHRDHILISKFLHGLARSVTPGATLIEYETSAPIRATHIVDITDVFDLKIAALGMHRTALACGDYLRAISGLNAYRGLYLGFDKFAEAFNVVSSSPSSVLRKALQAYRRWGCRFEKRKIE